VGPVEADALARQQTGMQLDQLPADSGGGAVAPATGSLVANAESINGNANLLIEIAGFLHEGRPDAELTTMARESREPRAPADVAKQVARFAGFAPLSPITPESLPWRLGGDPDNTFMGPIAIQVRRGAEVLGYDPEHLTDQQRGMVETTLQDPARTSSSLRSTWPSSRRRASSPMCRPRR
jgi:hypothetical protein